MDPAIELANTPGASQPTQPRITVPVNGDQRHSILRKPISRSSTEAADNMGHLETTDDQSSPSLPLMASNHAPRHEDEQEPVTGASTVSDDASTFDHTGADEKHLPPRPLRPLTSAQLSLLVVELLVVVAILISGIKGLAMLPNMGIFSVPPMSQDCGGYSVPSVERNFYINLQIVRNLTFTRAKLLDLTWDTVVGQGGKALHGWILYRVVASQLAWMMEYSSVPYQFQLDLLFSTVSLSALWSTIRFLFVKRPWRAAFSAVWFLLAILYVLAFSSIWSAATGYLNPSTPAYRMADQSYATVNSETFRLCLTIDTERVNGGVPAVVLGPLLGECTDSFSEFSYLSPDCDLRNGSDEWKDLIAYFETKTSIQDFFSELDSQDAVNETADFNDWGYSYPQERGEIDGVSFDYPRHGEQQVAGLYREFTGFQFAGVGQDPEVEKQADSPWFNATFHLDTSVDMSTWEPSEVLDPVPYNSTLWFNGSAITLNAPFLNMPANETSCEWFADESYTRTNPLCLCYRDFLLTSDFRQDDNLICISEEGYVWGFSSMITVVSIIIEVCWIMGCLGMWLDVHINSILFRMNRPSSGMVRNILDVGGAIQRDLGYDTGTYKHQELTKELKKCPPVGYEVDNSGKVARIAIVSVPGDRGRRNRPKVEPEILYA